MKTEKEVSLYLQKLRKRGLDPNRIVRVTFGLGCYGKPATALLEVQGSPPKGMALLRCRLDHHFSDGWENIKHAGADVLLLQSDDTMRRAVYEGAVERDLVAFVCASWERQNGMAARLQTPSNIEILLHCHVSPEVHPRLKAPAVQEGLLRLQQHGLIEPADVSDVWRTTDKGRAKVEELCQVRL